MFRHTFYLFLLKSVSIEIYFFHLFYLFLLKSVTDNCMLYHIFIKSVRCPQPTTSDCTSQETKRYSSEINSVPGFLFSEHGGQKVQPASTRLFAQISRNPAGFHIMNDSEGQRLTSGLRPSTLNLSPPVGTLCGNWAAVCPPAKCCFAKSDQVNRPGKKNVSVTFVPL